MKIRVANLAKKSLPVLLWLMTLYIAIVFLRNGIRKFDAQGFWAPAFQKWGYPVWFMYLIGVLETGAGIVILIPRWAHWGGITIAAVMVGALTTRLMHGVDWGDAIAIVFYMVAALYFACHYYLRRLDSASSEPIQPSGRGDHSI